MSTNSAGTFPLKVVAYQMNPIIGDLTGNTQKIIDAINLAKKEQADLIIFPELAITGYPPQDLLLLKHFIKTVENQLATITEATQGMTAIIGTPRLHTGKGEKFLCNSAAVLQDGKLLGFQDKMLLPTYDVFDERRYFEPGTSVHLWNVNGKQVAVTICEDIWQHSSMVKYSSYIQDPVLDLAQLKPDLVVNLSASPYHFKKFDERMTVCTKAAKEFKAPLILCNQVGGNDSLIFDGYSLCVNTYGQLIQCGKGFEEDFLIIEKNQSQTKASFQPRLIEDLYRALVLALRDYFRKLGFTHACLGLSGGIDSALVACIASDALGRENVLGIGMPSRFSSEGSVTEAMQLAHTLGIRYRHIPIEGPFQAYLDLLTPHFEDKPFDTTEENLQARVRGMILMAISNKLGYIVLSTGNKSELAMGYSTLYGDMCGGVGVINDVTKGLIYKLAKWINREQEIIPWHTIEKPPSAELRPNQKDSDSLPDYSIVDHVIEDYLEDGLSPAVIAKAHDYPLELVQNLVRKIHLNEYKRRQSPPGFRVTEKAFSVGRHFPIVQKWD